MVENLLDGRGVVIDPAGRYRVVSEAGEGGVPVPRDQRDQPTTSARLLRLVIALNNAWPKGIGDESLISVVGYPGDLVEQRDTLAGDVSELNSAGWDIQSVTARGARSRYLLRTRDTRMLVGLTRAEQAELARAARLQGERPSGDVAAGGVRADDSKDVTFWCCVEAVARGRRVRFVREGVSCVFHPRSVVPGPSGWCLVGRRDGSVGDTYVAIDQIEGLDVDQPRTADVRPRVQRHGLDPAAWDVDPPVEVSIDTAAEFAEDVDRAFGPALSRRSAGERVVLTFGVTNRAAFRVRLYGFGARVRVVAPAEIRHEIAAELSAFLDA